MQISPSDVTVSMLKQCGYIKLHSSDVVKAMRKDRKEGKGITT